MSKPESTANSDKLRDGELLPMIGGPYDGLYRKVGVLMPGVLDLPCAGISMPDGSNYRRIGREWHYQGRPGMKVK